MQRLLSGLLGKTVRLNYISWVWFPITNAFLLFNLYKYHLEILLALDGHNIDFNSSSAMLLAVRYEYESTVSVYYT